MRRHETQRLVSRHSLPLRGCHPKVTLLLSNKGELKYFLCYRKAWWRQHQQGVLNTAASLQGGLLAESWLLGCDSWLCRSLALCFGPIPLSLWNAVRWLSSEGVVHTWEGDQISGEIRVLTNMRRVGMLSDCTRGFLYSQISSGWMTLWNGSRNSVKLKQRKTREG